MIILDVPQLSTAWFEAKIGIPSAGSFDRIVTTKGEPSKQREDYLDELVAEIISGAKTETYQSYDMKDGIEKEPDARKLYEFINDVEVQIVGFCFYDEHRKYGSSPDGLVNPKGGLEIKKAKGRIQISRLRKGWSLAEHYQQVQGNLFITDREWWDLMSYSPSLPPLIIRIERDEKFIEKLKAELETFCYDLAITVKKLRDL